MDSDEIRNEYTVHPALCANCGTDRNTGFKRLQCDEKRVRAGGSGLQKNAILARFSDSGGVEARCPGVGSAFTGAFCELRPPESQGFNARAVKSNGGLYARAMPTDGARYAVARAVSWHGSRVQSTV